MSNKSMDVSVILRLLALVLFSSSCLAHEIIPGQDNPRGVQNVDFVAEHISRTFTAGYPDTFGLYAFSRREPLQYLTIGDKNCIKSNFLAFDVDDSFAFDINETVEVSALVKTSAKQSPKPTTLFYGFDKNGRADANGQFKQVEHHEDGLIWHTVSLPLARLANRGMGGSDIALTTLETMLPHGDLTENQHTTFILCDLKITRSPQQAKQVKNKIPVAFSFIDSQTGQETPVRVGLYDENGYFVPVSNSAVPLQFYEQSQKRHLNLRNTQPARQFWPHQNRYFFYSKGRYDVRLPAGNYYVIATKGPEFRITQKRFAISGNSNSVRHIQLNLKRWANMPAQGWFSGDVHIHMQRQRKDNRAISHVLKAEDLHVGNLLAMSNIGNHHFEQYAYGKQGTFISGLQAIVPGVEGPRTAMRGHAIALNVQKPIEPQKDYLLYHRHLQRYLEQNATTGYAHVGSEEFYASRGLALDVPFGLVDFVEILQNSQIRTAIWYEFLNLGFKLAPAAGSDFPYFDQPGAVRNYVKANKTFNELDWFDGLKAGQTFITNGPLIDFKVAGKSPGDKLQYQAKSLRIQAELSINPDIGNIDQIELIHCGDVVKRFSDNKNSISLDFSFTPPESGWLAINVKGDNHTLAHTGAVYLQDDNGSSQCHSKSEALAETMIERLDQLAVSESYRHKELEFWEVSNIDEQLSVQKKALLARIEMAKAFYKTQLKTSPQKALKVH